MAPSTRETTRRHSQDEQIGPAGPRTWQGVELEPDERIVKEFTESSKIPVLMGLGFWPILAWLFSSWAWLLFAVPGMIFAAWWTSERKYCITDKRIMARVGIFNKEATQIRLDRISNVSVERPFYNQAREDGIVRITTAGGPQRELVIPRLPDPDAIANLLRH